MRRRNRKSIILYLLTSLWLGTVFLYVTGCTDNPDAEAAKEMRSQTTQAVEMSVNEKDYGTAQDKVMALLERNRSGGLTKDAALLASGNLALVQGQQMQADLGLKTLPLRGSVDKLEKILRNSEHLLIEKERIEELLKSGDDEIAELQQLLDDDSQKESLKKQLELASTQMEQLLSQKASVQAVKDRTQAVLDDYQSNADNLMRQAELAKGDQRLDLEKQAFAILQERKDYYIKAQSAEDELSVLDSDIALVQVRVDGLTRSIQDVQQRIESIDASQTRMALKRQIQDIEESVRGNQQRLAAISSEVASGLTAYREMSNQICAVYAEAIAEFSKINSGDGEYAAIIRLADSFHYAALTSSASIKVQKYLSERLRTLLDTTDPQFLSAIQNKLQIQQDIDADYKKRTFAYFDQSVETYEKALSVVNGLSRNLKQEDRSKMQDAKCSLMKSEVLALHSKMQLADLMEDFDLATSTEAAMNELIQKGTELGVCFTQSETMRVIENEGLDYLPSLPLNMEVFVEGKKQELSVWKRLPINEQEVAVDSSIQEIDELIAQYGQEIALQLEPLKQEMLAAKERGFKEPAPGSSSSSEPNSLY